MSSLQIDCTTCVARDVACADCVVSVLLSSEPDVRLSAQEQAALRALADSGLVPPLRHQSRPRPHLRPVQGRLREARKPASAAEQPLVPPAHRESADRAPVDGLPIEGLRRAPAVEPPATWQESG